MKGIRKAQAHWIKTVPAFGDGYYICSKCRKETEKAAPICPKCGARMGGRLRYKPIRMGILP